MGTKFTVFDNALNPERALPDMSNARQELAGIIYVSPETAHHKRSASVNIQLQGLFGFKVKTKAKCCCFFNVFMATGNKRLGDEGAQKDDGYYSRNEQRQRSSTSET